MQIRKFGALVYQLSLLRESTPPHLEAFQNAAGSMQTLTLVGVN